MRLDFLFRDFTPQDRETFLDFCRTFYSGGAVLHAVPEENFSATFDTILAGSPYARGLMILCDGQTAGYALLSFTYSNEIGGLVVLLEEAFILPQFQGRGLGGQLLRFVEDEYRGRAGRLRLEVTAGNRAANLYERTGYQKLNYTQMIKDAPW